MKKIGIFLIAFLLLGSFAYAQDFSVDFGGEASAAFGADLEDETTGFTNSADAQLDVTFVPNQTMESEGDGWYGHIAIDFELVLGYDGDFDEDGTSLTDPDGTSANPDNESVVLVSVDQARITNDMAYVQIYGAPDDSSDAAARLFNFDDDSFLGDEGFSVLDSDYELIATFSTAAAVDSELRDNADDPFEPGFANGDNADVNGITIGYGDDNVINDISVGIVSDGDWTNNGDNAYAARLNVDVAPVDMVTLASTLYVGFDSTASGIAYGSSSHVSVEPVEGSTIMAAFDFQGASDAPDTVDLRWVASLGVEQVIAEDSHVALRVSASPDDGAPDEQVLDGADLQYDVGLLVREDTAAGFVPGVGAGLGVSLQNLGGDSASNTSTVGILADLEYDQGGLNPFVGAGYHMPLDGDEFAQGLGVAAGAVDDYSFVAYEVGLNLAEELHSIHNTVFTARYGTWDSVGSGADGTVIGGDADTVAGVAALGLNELRAGYLTLETTISY